DVAEDDFRRRYRFRRRQVVDERRAEERLGRVLLDLLRVFLVDRLVRIAPRSGGGEVDRARRPGGFLRLLLRRRGRRDAKGGQDRHKARHLHGSGLYRRLEAGGWPRESLSRRDAAQGGLAACRFDKRWGEQRQLTRSRAEAAEKQRPQRQSCRGF